MYTQADIDASSAQYDEMIRRAGALGDTKSLQAQGRSEEAQLELDKVRAGLNSQLTTIRPNTPTLIPDQTNLYVRTYGQTDPHSTSSLQSPAQELAAPQDKLVLERNRRPNRHAMPLPLAAGQDILNLDPSKLGADEKVNGRLMPVKGSE